MSLSLTVAAYVLAWGTVADAKSAIGLHAESLSRIKSIYVKLDMTVQEGNAPAQIMRTSESWRSGVRVKTVSRDYRSFGLNGLVEIKPPHGAVRTSGYGDREIRVMEGWDPEHPFPLPLDFAVSAKNLGLVKCTIVLRDPTDGTSSDWSSILIDCLPGISLPSLAQQSKIRVIEGESPGAVRLEVEESQYAPAKGMVVDLDPQHGYMIRRVAIGGGVADAEKFTKFDDDIWIPGLVRRKSPAASTTAEVKACRVNETIGEDELVVNFPEGARVDDLAHSAIYLWGTDKPAFTFKKDTELLQHLYQHARTSQSAARAINSRSAPIWSSPLFILNVVLVVVLFGLFFLRRRLVAES